MDSDVAIITVRGREVRVPLDDFHSIVLAAVLHISTLQPELTDTSARDWARDLLRLIRK